MRRSLRATGAACGVAAALLLSACGGGGDAQDSPSEEQSAFDVTADQKGEVPEVADVTNDDGTHTATVYDSTAPETSVSVRVPLPSGWSVGKPIWSESGQAPGVVKAIFVNNDKKLPDEGGRAGMTPRVYLSITDTGTPSEDSGEGGKKKTSFSSGSGSDAKDDQPTVNSYPLDQIATLPDWQMANKGPIAMGSKQGYFYSGTWANAGNTNPERSAGTVVVTLVPSGGTTWAVAMVAARGATGGEDSEQWWTSDLEAITSGVQFKSLPAPTG